MTTYKHFDEIQQDIVNEFSIFPDWYSKYSYLIDLGKKLQGVPQEFCTEENRMLGCMSSVWIKCDHQDGRLFCQGMSDAAIVSGLIALVIRTYNGQKLEDVPTINLWFIKEIGLEDHLSPQRATGLSAMIDTIKKYAITAVHGQH